MKIFFALLLASCMRLPLNAENLQLISFETDYACPPYEPRQAEKNAYKWFSLAVSNLPEQAMIPMSLVGASFFYDFQSDTPLDVAATANHEYQKIRQDPLVGPIRSTLAYSFSAQKPEHGYYYLYTPEKVTEDTRLLLFFHGFGGCFKYFSYFLKEAFPDDIILLPVYGHSGGVITKKYLSDMWSDLGKHISAVGKKPWLIGLSAGGYGVFRIYSEKPEHFSGMISIASFCPDQHLPRLRSNMKVLMINGNNEQGITEQILENQRRQISSRVNNFELQLVEGTHFFLFKKSEEVGQIMRQFIEKHSNN